MGYECPRCRKSFQRACELGNHQARFRGGCANIFGSRRVVARTAEHQTPRQSEAAAVDPQQSPPPEEGPSSASEDNTEQIAELGLPAFDSGFEFVRLVHSLNNGAGLAKQDIQLLLGLLRHPDFRIDQVRKSVCRTKHVLHLACCQERCQYSGAAHGWRS